MGKAVKSVAKKVAGTAGGLLFGKEQTIGADPLAGDIRGGHKAALEAQGKVLGEVNKMSAADLAKKATEREAKFLRGSAADARRRLQENIARKGLGRSSLALTAGRDIDTRLGEQLAASQAGLGQRRLGFLQQKANIINPIHSATRFPVQMRDAKLGKKGGISGLLGGVVGGLATGGTPQGVGAGMQVGEGLKSVF